MAEKIGQLPPTIIPVAFGGIVAVMIYSLGHISGAHFNPAVSISFWLAGKLQISKLVGYIISQFIGAVLASLSHILIFGAEHSFGATSTNMLLTQAYGVEVLFTCLLMFVITAVATDSRAIGSIAGAAIGMTVTLAAYIAGPLTGASLNPARSFGPMLVSMNFENLLLYMVAPVIGAIIGGFMYSQIKCMKHESQKEGCC